MGSAALMPLQMQCQKRAPHFSVSSVWDLGALAWEGCVGFSHFTFFSVICWFLELKGSGLTAVLVSTQTLS